MHGHARLIVCGVIIVIIAAVGILVVIGVGGHAKSVPTSYGFDSPYEINRAESYVNEVILRKEENTEGEGLSEETRIDSTHCVLTTPGPITDGLACSVLVGTHVLYRNAKASRLNRWKATVSMNPRDGELSLTVTKANNAG